MASTPMFSGDEMEKQRLKDIFDEVRTHLSLSPQSPKSLLLGDWDSDLIGEGMEFEEFKEYRDGDNPRRIHAAMSSRMGKPIVVRHLEPRETRCLVVLDATPSMMVREKMEIAFAALGMIFSSAHEVHMPIGIWLLDHLKEFDMRPPVTHAHMEYVIDAICGIDSDNPYLRDRESELNLDNWNNFLPGGSFIFVISDFFESPENNFMQILGTGMPGYKVVPVIVQDSLEYTFPQIPSSGAEIPIVDSETGVTTRAWVDADKASSIRKQHEERFQRINDFFERRFIYPAHTPNLNVLEIYGSLQNALL